MDKDWIIWADLGTLWKSICLLVILRQQVLARELIPNKDLRLQTELVHPYINVLLSVLFASTELFLERDTEV